MGMASSTGNGIEYAYKINWMETHLHDGIKLKYDTHFQTQEHKHKMNKDVTVFWPFLAVTGPSVTMHLRGFQFIMIEQLLKPVAFHKKNPPTSMHIS